PRQPAGAKAQEHRDQVNRLRTSLEKKIAEDPDYALVKMLHAGSVAKGTALKTVNDLDVAVYVKQAAAPVNGDAAGPVACGPLVRGRRPT
ncbi:MAG: nucleotidyltransferase domain-containing protein, partial [Acidimicrobiia bacterium]|nr:nucleotidyltransferase domain-containing protein [Acidimicrobiia bacterium]